jgi:transposase
VAEKRRGRPSKFAPPVCQKIVDVIRAGNFVQTAAEYAGVDRSTVYDWVRRGERERQGPYREFAEQVRKALADAEVRDLAIISKAAGEGQWQAAAWRLERKFPERYGRRHPSFELMEQRLTAQIAVMNARLGCLETKTDDKEITVIIPDVLARDEEK